MSRFVVESRFPLHPAKVLGDKNQEVGTGEAPDVQVLLVADFDERLVVQVNLEDDTYVSAVAVGLAEARQAVRDRLGLRGDLDDDEVEVPEPVTVTATSVDGLMESFRPEEVMVG